VHISSEVDRFTSNRDQIDHQPILHILSNAYHQWKCCIVVIFVCNFRDTIRYDTIR